MKSMSMSLGSGPYGEVMQRYRRFERNPGRIRIMPADLALAKPKALDVEQHRLSDGSDIDVPDFAPP